MAISTLNSHIEAALNLQGRVNSAYMVLGKTSAWSDEQNPPNETESVSELTEVIGYKKVSRFSLARPLASGETVENVGFPTVTYSGQTWVLIPRDQAYTQKARWLYVEAEIHPNEFPLGMYRQVGLHLGVVPSTGVSKQNLRPNEVANKGILEFYENREPQNRTSSVYVLEQFIIRV